MRVLVLGASGMLGSMVEDCLKKESNLEIIGTSRKPRAGQLRFDVHDGLATVPLDGVDYVINCIGITKPYCDDERMAEVRNAIGVNSVFPHDLACLAEEKDFRVIQIATDCVYSGLKGNYDEDSPHDAADVYGKTKSLGEVRSSRYLNIRCSIVGPERFNKAFLLEWFLGNERGATVKGFSHHRWNGVTTLQFARLCKEIIEGEQFDRLNQTSALHHFLPNETVSKFQLLKIFNHVFERGLRVEEVSGSGAMVDRTLATKLDALARLYSSESMDSAILELRQYVDATGFYRG